jgi:adenylate kinase
MSNPTSIILQIINKEKTMAERDGLRGIQITRKEILSTETLKRNIGETKKEIISLHFTLMLLQI